MSTPSVLSEILTAVLPGTASRSSSRDGKVRPAIRDLRARELLDLFEQSFDVDSLEALRTTWVESLGMERAAVELTKVMRAGPPRDRATAFCWLLELEDVAEAAVRVALEQPNVRPYAVVWLRESGLPGPDPTPDEVRWLYVDLLAVALGDEERLAASAMRRVAADGSPQEQVDDVAILWRSDHPATAEVLDMLSRRHPEPAVAEAARVAAARLADRAGEAAPPDAQHVNTGVSSVE
jgi:hypothetical protein